MSDITIKTIPLRPIAAPGKTKKIQNSMTQTKDTVSNKDDPKLLKACAEFEALFISQLLKEMRETIPKSGLMSGGKGEEIYTYMLDSEIAKEIALNSGLGIASLMRSQIEDVKK
jgi:flagellar protein FlgJ